MVALALVVAVLWPSAARASDAARLKPGVRIAVELVSGPPVAGTVRSADGGGFIVQPNAGEPVFVAFRSVLAYLDPDTGKVIAQPRIADTRVLKATVITAVIVGGLLLAVHSLGSFAD
jgi:hypothetical protein